MGTGRGRQRDGCERVSKSKAKQRCNFATRTSTATTATSPLPKAFGRRSTGSDLCFLSAIVRTSAAKLGALVCCAVCAVVLWIVTCSLHRFVLVVAAASRNTAHDRAQQSAERRPARRADACTAHRSIVRACFGHRLVAPPSPLPPSSPLLPLPVSDAVLARPPRRHKAAGHQLQAR